MVSAGEASGDLYAAAVVEALRERFPEAEFFGCAGPRMKKAGVEAVVDAASLSVVGLVEVLAHIPRIYREYRKLCRTAIEQRPEVAILTDSPDFHLRVARRLRKAGIPVVYLVAPQVWAWRKGRIHTLRRNVSRLLCIFPFEEKFFCDNGVPAVYLGHPLARMVKPSLSREEFFGKHRLPTGRPLIALLPGSRSGELARHLPCLLDTVDKLHQTQELTFVLATPAGAFTRAGLSTLAERLARSPVKVVEGQTWDVLASADLALAASGTVTVEAALLGTPMVTYYKVTGLSWLMGKFLVDVPFYSMVNLVAGRKIVPELMQDEMNAENLAQEARRLLDDEPARSRMRQELADVAASLASVEDPMRRAAHFVEQFLKRD